MQSFSICLRKIDTAEPDAYLYHPAGHVWHTPLEGYVLVPDLTCPVFEDISLV